MSEWAEHLCETYKKALESPDPSTQNGAMLVMSLSELLVPLRETLACNEFPKGVVYSDDRWERPAKYQYVEHAERNAIYAAARKGILTEGLVMVCSWAACADCARAIIQAGIRKLVTHKQAYDRSPQFWRDSVTVAYTMLEEAGVEVVMYSGYLGAAPLLHSGEIWNP